MPDDYSADRFTTGTVAVGDTATGNIGSNGDGDWFAVELVAGRTYVIDLRGSPTGDGTLNDPYLRGVYDADGNLIPRTTNDDGGEGYNSRVTFTATESGTHDIAAGAAGVYFGRGTYEVEVTDTSPPIVAPDPDPEDPLDTQEQVQQQPPAFGSQFYGFDLAENADGNTNRISLGTVSATDPDGVSVTYSIEGGNAAGLFEIDAASGELFYTGGGENYETGSTNFELTVRASDGDQTTDTTVAVNVTDVAEAPAFGQAGYGFDLAEDTDGSTNRISLGTVSATDPDGGSVTYSIEGGNAAGLFEIDAASGELFYTGGGEDYETGSTSFELTVRASDGDQTTDTTATVSVTDVDEPVEVGPPVAQPDPARAAAEDLGDITELAAPLFPLGTLDGAADGVAWYRFTLSEAREVALGLRRQDADADLVVEDAAGNVLHSGANDGTANEWVRETLLAGTYYVRVEAQEAGANAYVFRYGVGDADPAEVARLEAERTSAQEQEQEQVQQQPPAFGSQFYGFDLPENTDGSADRLSLGTVSATDPDGGSVTYSIEGGNAAGLFEIDAASGELFYTGGGEDYETGSTSFELTVRASDGDQTTDTTVAVNVTDVSEAPAFAQAGYGFDLAEDTDGSTNRISLGTVSATDPDGGSVTYSIEGGNAAGLFEIDAASGELFYTGGGEDYETGSTSFELTVRASDGDQTTDTTATVSVTDVDEPVEVGPPVAQPDPARAAAEDLGDITELAAPLFPLGTLDGAADGVAWYRFTLSEAREVALGLRRQDADADLVVEDAAGNVLHSGANDGTANEWVRETLLAGTYYVRVEAQEAGANAYVFRYGVGDADPAEVARLEAERTSAQEQEQEQVQQQPPAFGSQFYGFDLPENTDGSADRLSLGTVSATDPDGRSVTYSIEGGNAAGLFEIDAASGELFYTGGGEDYESSSTSFELTVRASDGDQTTDTPVAVNVTDVAEAPAFAQAGYGFDLAEDTDGSANRISLGTVSATDPDGRSVTYSIEGGNAAGLFEIDAASGELFYTGGGEDYDTGSTSFELTVRASDGDQTTDTTVAVSVTDVDEPVVVDPPVAQPDQTTPQTVSEPAGEDFSAGTSTIGRVAVGDTATGNIEPSHDRDWFAVELVAGRTYVIDLRGTPTNDGTLSDPYLRGIHDSDGNLIPRTTNDDGGQGLNSRVTFTATESGTHYIAAGVYSGQGTYEVEVTDTSPPIVAPDPDPEDPPVTPEQVQQQPPAFGPQFYGFDLAENADGSADRLSLGTVSATDPDGRSVTYSIEGGNAAGLFEIDAASGELFYTGAITESCVRR